MSIAGSAMPWFRRRPRAVGLKTSSHAGYTANYVYIVQSQLTKTSLVTESSMSEVLQRITVCGLGKLGTCVAACLAARGFEVVGIDIDLQKVESLRKGKAPV